MRVRARQVISIGVVLLSGVAQRSWAQAPARCASLPLAGQATERGWAAYRKNDLAGADAEFKRALALCPGDAGALTGAGYAAMRRGRMRAAGALFDRALARDSASYDAAAGAGMTAYRAGNLPTAQRHFSRALQIVPGDSLARAYLQLIPEQIGTVVLPPHIRPATTAIAARTGTRIFEVPDSAGRFTPLWIKAVNLGAALPGKHPAEFPPSDSTYERWIALVADMGANAIRVYTIHPPHFYTALRLWNLAHPARPVWLIHGVWTELPPGARQEKYDDPRWLAQFHGEMRRVASLLHGDAAIPALPGHASGVYRADVSPWTLGYIIGREWEPYSVVAYNASRDRKSTRLNSSHG